MFQLDFDSPACAAAETRDTALAELKALTPGVPVLLARLDTPLKLRCGLVVPGRACLAPLTDAAFEGLTDLTVSNAGTLYGANGDQVVIVRNITTTPGTPVVLDWPATGVAVIE